MKLWKIAVPVLMLTCLASVASAAMMQSEASPMKGQFTITGMGGLEVPTGNLSEKFTTTNGLDQGLGWDAGGAVDYFFTDQIAIGADVHYFASKNKDTITDETTGNTVDVKAKTLEFGLHGKWFLPMGGGKVMPWLGVGVGMYNRKLTASESGVSDIEFKDNKVGGHAAVGIGYKLTDMVGLGVSGAYHLTGKFEDTDSATGVGVKTDNWSFIAINAALTLHFSKGMGGGGMK